MGLLGLAVCACAVLFVLATCNTGGPAAGVTSGVTDRSDGGTDGAVNDNTTDAPPADNGNNDSEPPPTDDEMPIPNEPPEDDLLEGTPNAEYLDTLTLDHVRVGGQVFLVWVVDDSTERERGLMFVTEEELEPLPDGRGRGMLFIWRTDNNTSFWMKNTITALDVAFIEEDGVINTLHTMTPLDLSIYPPNAPYRYALEVVAGTFADLGVEVGDTVELP
jgi:uncharacterized membrane protein (UPF0127 family)